MNEKESKLYNGLLSLGNRYLSTEVNLRAVESMKSASEEVLFEAGKHHVELTDWFHVSSERISFLENQRSLWEADYEAFLQENKVMRAHLVESS